MGRKVLTESCVIQCCHGGTVDHPSSDAIRVIGGLKPNFCVDILDAPISGCPIPITPCTKVAAIADAMTEPNVTGSGGTYALDVSGCQTDQGASLKIASRANKNSASAVKAGTDNSVEGIEPSQEEEKIAKELIVKEKYKLYLLRESQNINFEKVYKPLRGSRAFADILTFYGNLNTHPSIREKVVPFTLAFVYIKLSTGIINEYRILSKGSLYAETFNDIQYKDKNTTRDYIPLNDGEKIEIFYSNIQLSSNKAKQEEMLSKLLGIQFDPTDARSTKNSFFLKDINAIDSNIISPDTLKLQKKYDPITDNEPYPLDVVTTIPDAVGEVEDMQNIYEWRYKMNFCANDQYLNQLKKKNAYTYAIADKMDYFYISQTEQKKYDTNIKKLKILYTKLADEICQGKLSSIIIKNEDEITPLNQIINPVFHTAQNYFNEVSHINKSFFRNILAGEKHTRQEARHGIHKHPYNEEQFVVSKDGLSCKYVGVVDFTSLNEQNVYARRRYKSKKETIKVSDVNYGYLVLDDPKDVKYKAYEKNPSDILALLVFAICFSDKYKKEVQASGVYETAKDFYYTLKDSLALPAIGDENIEDVKTLINSQKESYAPICNKTNKLLEQFESIDILNKEYSFDTTTIKSPSSVFSDLYIPSELQSFFKSPDNPKDILQEVKKLIQKTEFKTMIEAYASIKEFDTDTNKKEYLNTTMGLLYTAIANTSSLDAQANVLSPFNAENKHLIALAEHIVELKNGIKDETFHTEIFSLPINKHYRNTFHSYISHAMVPTNKNKKGFDTRDSNAKAFLDKHIISTPTLELDISDLLAQNFGISQEAKVKLKDYYAALINIEGYSSKVAEAMEKYKESQDDMFEQGDRKKAPGFQNSKKYKNLLASLKTLTIFVAGVKVLQSFINYDKLKFKDVFPLIGDIYTTISSFGKVMPKTKDAVTKSVQEYMNEKTLKKTSSLKTMTKIGIIGVAISALYEIEALEDNDIDGGVAIIAKNITVISFLLAPTYLALVPGIGWIAALGTLAVEIAWNFYIKDIFIDTPLESYIMKSLLYYEEIHQGTGSNFSARGYANYRPISNSRYETILFKEAVNKEENKLINGFSSFKEVQNFIGDNHEQYEELFNNALQYELNALQAVAFGYKIDIVDTTEKKTYDNQQQTLQTKIKIPKTMLQNNIQVLFKIDMEYKTLYESPEIALSEIASVPEDLTYDTIARNKLVNDKIELSNDITLKDAKKLADKEVFLFLVNRDIALKYHIVYDFSQFTPHGYTRYKGWTDTMSLSIKEIKLTPLEIKEKTMIENIVYARKEKEKKLQKESN